jgi:hypothetical protein
MPTETPPPSLQAHIKRLWLHGFLAGFVVVLIILVVMYFFWGWPSTTPEVTEGSKPAIPQALAPAVAPTAPGSEAGPPAVAGKFPPATIKADLEAVLARLAEANKKKDLPLLLSLYDPAFSDLQQKSEEVSRTWDIYDYLSLRFRIEEIKSTSPDAAVARVIWEAGTRNRATGKIEDFTIAYLVHFTNDSGHWRIKSLEKIDKPGQQGKS